MRRLYPELNPDTNHSDCFSQYQRREPQSPQSSAAAPSSPDLQRCLCQAEQGLNQHAQDCRALHCLGVRI